MNHNKNDNLTISDKIIAKRVYDFFIKNADKSFEECFLDYLEGSFAQHRVFSLMDSHYASKK